MAHKKWEYVSLKIDFNSFDSRKLNQNTLDKKINIFGEDGWELVNFLDTKHSGSTKQVHCIFKREKME